MKKVAVELLKMAKLLISEEREELIQFAKDVQKKLESKARMRFKRKTGTSRKPFVGFEVKNWQDEVIPNEIRVLVAKTLGVTGVKNWDNVNYGNITPQRIVLRKEQWEKVLKKL